MHILIQVTVTESPVLLQVALLLYMLVGHPQQPHLQLQFPCLLIIAQQATQYSPRPLDLEVAFIVESLETKDMEVRCLIMEGAPPIHHFLTVLVNHMIRDHHLQDIRQLVQDPLKLDLLMSKNALRRHSVPIIRRLLHIPARSASRQTI